jgi:hypothetical protein
MLRDKIGIVTIVLVLLLAVVYPGWILVSDRLSVARATKRAPVEWTRIHTGMSTQDVVALLGQPPVRDILTFGPNAFGRVFPPEEQWHYAFGETGQAVYSGRYVLVVTNGHVASAEIR